MQKDKLICRGLALLLCLAMVAGFVPVGMFIGVEANAVTTAAADDDNMVVNGGFDGDLDTIKESWGVNPGPQSSVEVVDGSLQVTAAVVEDDEGNMLKGSYTYFTQVFNDVKEYNMYELTLKYKWTSGDTKPYAALRFYKDKASNSNFMGASTHYIADQSGNWVTVTVSAVVPTGANVMEIEMGTNSGATVTYAFDDVSLVKTGDYVFAETFDAFNSGNAFAGPAGWLDSDVNNENLVGCYDGNSAYEGYALHFQSQDNQWAESPMFDVKAGHDYTVKFMAKKSINNSSFTGYGAIVFVDANGNEVGSREKLVGRSVGDWEEEYFIGVAPEGAVKAYLVFGYDKQASAYGIDNLTVTESENTSVRDPEATDPDEEAPEFVFELINGGFENGMTGWAGGSNKGATNELVTEGAYNGGTALKLTAQANENDRAVNTFYQDLDVTGLKAVELKAVAKAADLTSADSGYVGLWFYDEQGALTPENTAFSFRLGDTADWTEYSLIQAVPENATRVRLEFGNNSGCSGLFFLLDEISLEIYTGPEENIKPATPAAPSGGSSGTKYPAVIVDESKLNASLEELDDKGMPVGWRLTGNPVYTIEQPADAPDGKNVIQMAKLEQGGASMHSPRIACEPGETYELKVMAKDIVGTCIIGLYVYAADGTRLDDACKVAYTDGSGKWKMYVVLSAMPENAAGIELEVWGAVASTFTVQVDALMMKVSEEKLKPPYVPTPYEYPTVEELTENLVEEHPRIYFNAEEAKEIKLRRFNTLKTKYGWTWNKQYTELLKAADEAFDVTTVRVSMNTGKWVYMDIWEDVNSQHNRDKYLAASYDDDGTKFEEPYTGFGCLIQTQLSDMMKNWSLAYVMTGKTKYSDQAIKMAMNIASWEWWIDKNWTDKKNIYADASIAWMMDGMAAVYDICYNEMTPEQRKTLERSIIEKGLVPLSQEADPNSTVNGNLMMVGGILTGAAAILSKENAAEVKQYLDKGLLCMHNALDNYAFSGNTEGHYYTDFGLETFAPGIGQFYRATQMEGIIDHYFLTDILPYWTIMWASNQTATHPNYSDGSINAYMKIPMGVLQKLTDNPLIDGFLMNSGGVGGYFENLVYLKTEPEPEYLTDYAGVIEEFGYGALRTGFADDDMLLTLKANDSQMGHNHYDQNGILFAVGGSWLIQDPGAGSYYYSDRTFWTNNGHSTIMVDGNSQMIKGTGTTEMVFNNNLYSYIVGSAPRAYGSDFFGRILSKYDRHAIQVNHEDKGYYVIIDDLLSAGAAREYTWVMYNGSRGRFSVDDVELAEEGTAMGNKVTLPMGKNVLNVNFVSGDQLAIQDKLWKAGSMNAGMTVNATSAASVAHQFMTVLSTDQNSLSNYISFYDIMNGMRSTNPENIVEGEISWSSSMPLGQEILKPNMIGTTPCVFFRGNKVGDWLEIPFIVDTSGTYEVKLTMGVSDGCCTISASFDGEHTVENIDCSGLPEDFIDIDFGQLELEAGTHTVRMTVTDKGYHKDYAAGWYLINAGGIDLMQVGVEIPPAEDLVVTEVIDNEEALAGMINYKDNKYDFLMWNRTEGAATAGLLNTDAQQASVLGLIDGNITEGFAATNATTATYDGKVLFVADKKVDIVASDTGWQIISEEEQTVKLTAVAPELDYAITINGEATDSVIENGILTVTVGAGETAVVVDVDEPEVVDPTDPDEEDPTEPEATDPVQDPTEAPDASDNDGGNDATLWIIIAIAVVVVAGAAVAIVLVVKKRKAA